MFLLELAPSKRSLQRFLFSSVSQAVLILFVASLDSSLLAQAPPPALVYQQITAAFEAGKFQEAEQKLRQILEKRPQEIRALSLMGAVLDTQKKYDEAETFYKKALEFVPNSPQLNNNLGNHYMARGQSEQAQAAYLRVVAADPRQANANLQLAILSVGKKKGQQALKYLDRLPQSEQTNAPIRLLRAQALFWNGDPGAARSLLSPIEREAAGDLRLLFSLGMAFVAMEQFEEAERTFSKALEADPANFDILYNLGWAAMRAGHQTRAEEIFQTALRQRPDNVDCLYGLARVYIEQANEAAAIPILVKAKNLAPNRPEILLALAKSSEKLNFPGDTALAYDEYLKLRPQEDVARRERGFALVRSGKLQEGMQDLEWYVKRHPKEPWGFYRLGIGETLRDRTKAMDCFNQALTLDPNMIDVRFSRGVLFNQMDKPAEAVADLQPFLKQHPQHVQALDQLGRAYLQLGRSEEAAKVLKQATELAPDDQKILFQYSRALRKLGRTAELEQVLARFESLGGGKAGLSPKEGLFDFLSLAPQQQQARYLASLRSRLVNNPSDMDLKGRLGQALLEAGDNEEALKFLEEVRQNTIDAKLLGSYGAVLLQYEQYGLAQAFLEKALSQDSSSSQARLDLAIAVSQLEGAEAGLREIDKAPESNRDGDYYLLRARLLDSLGRVEEAAEALNRGFKASPKRTDLYFHASLFLVKHGWYQQTLDLLRQASGVVAGSPECQLVKAIALESIGNSEDARQDLLRLQSQYPEWYLPYLISGIILQNRRQAAEAKPLLETAIALGAKEGTAYYYLALASMDLTSAEHEKVRELVSQALKLSPHDPYVLSLAGRTALARKDYATATKQLLEAVQSNPDMIEAHFALSRLYRATGDQAKMEAELAETDRLTKLYLPGQQLPSALPGLLFSVRPVNRPYSKP